MRALPWPDDDVHAFVHGEAGAVKELRRYLRLDRGLGLDRLSITGYWRLGVDDEGWRACKRAWNEAIEQEESVARCLPGAARCCPGGRHGSYPVRIRRVVPPRGPGLPR